MFKFEKVQKFANVEIAAPIRKTENSACYDMVAAEDVVVQPYLAMVNTLADIVSSQRITEEARAMAERIQDTQGEDAVNKFVNSIMTCSIEEVGQLTKATGLKPTLISTGHKAYMDEGYSLDLYIRSSSPLKYWLIMANSTGIIDADYVDNPDNEGEIFFQVINMLPFPIKIKKGEIIGQGKFVKYETTIDDEKQTKYTRVGGFGSTTEQDIIVEDLNTEEQC